ncbi:STAS domain-containing protein [Paenibacillus sp. YYML68]|uniref:STAS domain-containing protein n=1 Tax=Paenibacillus sp. YYML68 TaxID=2909250 RepID=UPI0024919E6F|nr:STAS domain-containing protein [Paenibacillus sp. YYML68]
MEEAKFQVEAETVGEGRTFKLSGELDLASAPMFRSIAVPAAANAAEMRLNLKGLTYIDSTGIGIIVSVLKERQAVGRSLLVEDIPPKIRRLFDMTGLTQFLTLTEGGGG